MAYELAPLPYDYAALEPFIDAETMHLHHDKHHQAYVNNLNATLASDPVLAPLAAFSVDDLVRNIDKFPLRQDPLGRTQQERSQTTHDNLHLTIALSEDVRKAIRNNAGGHANHAAFWRLMGPVGSDGIGGTPIGPIAAQITADFGDFETFKKTFNETTAKQFGSGWGWLVFAGGKLKVITTPNQDSPLSQGLYPILFNDIWEHAYYLKYQNRRPDYLAAWWNVVNWHEVNKRFAVAKG